MPDTERDVISIRMTGRVQGVGLRYFIVRLANEFGMRGFVRNEPDGSVYVECYPGNGFDMFLEKLRAEHPGHIDNIKITRVKTEEYLDSFMIRH